MDHITTPDPKIATRRRFDVKPEKLPEIDDGLNWQKFSMLVKKQYRAWCIRRGLNPEIQFNDGTIR